MRKYLLVGGLIGVLCVGFMLSGCLIHGPDTPTKVPNILRLSPSYLEALPKGSIYMGWLVNGEFDQETGDWIPDDPSMWKKFATFNWDPYAHQPTNASGGVIENRFDTEVNIFDYERIFITIEDTKNTGVSSGTVILRGEVDLMNEDADLDHPINTAGISKFVDENWFYIFSQTDGPWYDNETVENGIWFGRVDTADVVWFDTEGVIYYCEDTATGDWLECDSTDYDSIFYIEVVHVDTNGDTTVTPSLTTMPNAADGWEYEAWITFTDDSPYKKPLSLGRFARPDGPDDDTSYSIVSNYDRHFSIPGEDFFQNVPFFGRLDVVESPYTHKLFITVEPVPDFDEDEPFWQLIIFSTYIPKSNLFYSPISGNPVTLQWPLILRDIGYDLNEGHRWPLMHIDFERDLILE